MKTEVCRVADVAGSREVLEYAATRLKAGGLVVFPTETVYGLGANALDPDAVAGIFAAKGRPQDNPLIVHITRMADLEEIAGEVTREAKLLAERFWPGPLTIVLPGGKSVPAAVSAGLDTIAVRMPSHPVARALIALAGVPVAAPSANLSGSPSPTTAAHCVADLDGRVDMILDGGSCAVGLESTVVTLAQTPPRLLRPGAVTAEELREILPALELDPAVIRAVEEGAVVTSPGMKYKHYAPRAALHLVHGDWDAYCQYVEARRAPGVFGLVFDGEEKKLAVPAVAYGPETDEKRQGEALFASLRLLDERQARLVYVRAPRTDGVGLAVYNRLLRASAFREVYLQNESKKQG